MNIHVADAGRSYRFGKFDRIVHEGQTYRYIGKERRVHILQLVQGEFVEDHIVRLSDSQIDKARYLRRFHHEVGYFSLIEKKLKTRNDDSDLSDLDDERLARIHWRHRWVREFLKLEAEHGNEGRPRVGRSPALMATAIEHLSTPVAQWYAETFARGRAERKVPWEFPAPSVSSLYKTVRTYEEGGYRIEALRDHRSNCGNRNQLHPEVRAVIDAACRNYMTRSKPTKAKIVQEVHDAIGILNQGRPAGDRLSKTSPRIVRDWISRLNPFAVKLGREGEDAAVRWFSLVGKGVACERPLQRVEIDDWEFDLQALLCTKETLGRLSKKQIAALQRRRCTLTVAIDCCTSAVVGINLSEQSASAATAIGCLKSLSVDKTVLARQAGCRSDWPMYGRPAEIVTDKGSAFKLEFEEVVRQIRSGRSIPDADPRKRGHIERFFGTLAMTFPSWFSGATQSNVVAKGDYEAEAFASLTVDQLFLFLIRWIVDIYHLTPHTALEGLTPKAVWDRLANDEEGLEMPLGDEERRRIFGFRRSRKLSREGILFGNVYYQSPELGWLLANRVDRTMEIRVDPDDLGSLLVRVPRDVKDHACFGGRHFFEVRCLDERMRGVTLASWLDAQEVVREFAHEQDEKNEPIRIQARQDLFQGGQAAMLAAGISDHVLTQKVFDMVMDVAERNGHAALNSPADRAPDRGEAEPWGWLAAEAPDDPSPRPVGDTVRRRKKREPQPAKPIDRRIRPLQPRFDDEDEQ